MTREPTGMLTAQAPWKARERRPRPGPGTVGHGVWWAADSGSGTPEHTPGLHGPGVKEQEEEPGDHRRTDNARVD